MMFMKKRATTCRSALNAAAIPMMLTTSQKLSNGFEARSIRRYPAGPRTMRRLYLPLVDAGLVRDNSGAGQVLTAVRSSDASLVVHDPARWALIEKATT